MSHANETVTLRKVSFSQKLPFTLIAGPCQMESRDHAMMIAERMVRLTSDLGIGYVFKASFDKANRTSLSGRRGIGLAGALPVFEEVSRQFDVPVLTDVHEYTPMDEVASVVDVLQTPAFLVRQTDFIRKVCSAGKPVNIKKPQFISPPQMKNIVAKIREAGNERIILCERGAQFGCMTSMTDITEPNRVRRQLSASYERFTTVLEALDSRLPLQLAVQQVDFLEVAAGLAVLEDQLHEPSLQRATDPLDIVRAVPFVPGFPGVDGLFLLLQEVGDIRHPPPHPVQMASGAAWILDGNFNGRCIHGADAAVRARESLLPRPVRPASTWCANCPHGAACRPCPQLPGHPPALRTHTDEAQIQIPLVPRRRRRRNH